MIARKNIENSEANIVANGNIYLKVEKLVNKNRF